MDIEDVADDLAVAGDVGGCGGERAKVRPVVAGALHLRRPTTNPRLQ